MHHVDYVHCLYAVLTSEFFFKYAMPKFDAKVYRASLVYQGFYIIRITCPCNVIASHIYTEQKKKRPMHFSMHFCKSTLFRYRQVCLLWDRYQATRCTSFLFRPIAAELAQLD